MRFKLTLAVNKKAFGNRIPINYQYEQSAVIYKILSRGNAEYSSWLHENGFTLGANKKFKMFTFSRLIVPQYGIDKENQRLIIFSDTVEWYISFLPDKSTEKFIQGVFQSQTFEIGDKKSAVQFEVRSIDLLPPLEMQNEYTVETLSPICISLHNEDGTTKYLSPLDDRFKTGLLTGALNRYKAYHGKDYTGNLDFDFKLLNEPKSVLIKFKADTPTTTSIRGYLCKFKIKAPYELMKILWDSGFGEKGSLGFGCGEKLIANNNI